LKNQINFAEVFKFKHKRKMKLIPLLVATTQAFGIFGQPLKIWGSWSSWGCQGRVRTRQAACLGGFLYCWGPLIEREEDHPLCIPKPTTIWGAWESWGLCDATQTPPKRTRQAACLAGAPVCYGPLQEDEICEPPKPVTIWASWGAYGPCINGIRTREAACLAGAPTCYGPLSEEEPCAMPTPAAIWGTWGAFGPCISGTRTRQAPCLAGAPVCYGPLEEDMACAPPAPVSIWGAWSNGGAFGACNPATGRRSRSKPCLAGPPTCYGDLVEEELCSARPGVIYN
jgi:hypothetical protein